MCNRINKKLCYGIAIALCLFNFCALTAGEVVLTPVSVAASSQYSEWGEKEALIDGSGMSGEGGTATHSCAAEKFLYWHSASSAVISNQWVQFDLGRRYNLANALIWQLCQPGLTERGVKKFTIKVAGENGIFSTVSTNNALYEASGTAPEPAQIIAMAAQGVRYVRLEVDSNYGAPYVGLSEVRFEMAAPPLLDGIYTLTPQNVIASTYYSDGSSYGPQFTIDDSGMTGSDRFATHSNQNTPKLFWHSNGTAVPDQWLEFDLGAAYHVTNAVIWQIGQSNKTSRGIQEFDIQVAGTNHLFSTYSAGNILDRASSLAQEYAQVFSLVTQDVRYVRFEIDSNYGDTYVGLSEVRFEVIQPPSRDLTWNGSAGNAEWNTLAQNWLTNSAATAFGMRDSVLFDDSAEATTATISGNLAVGDLVVDNTGTNRIDLGTTFGKRINEAASFIKRGAGTLEMGGGSENVAGSYHSFTCDVQILEGTVKLISDSKNGADPVEGLLGNPSVDRKIVVTNGATLLFGANNAIGTTLSSPKVKLNVVDGGILENAAYKVNTLGSALFDNAVIAPLTGNYDDWGAMVLNGDLEFKGSTPYTITSLAGAYLIIGFTGMPSIMVDDISGDDSADLTFNIAVKDTHGVPSKFNKTGAGTLRLNTNLSSFTGNVAVVEGVLETGAGNGMTNQYNNVLGNCKVPRTLSVASGAKLKITGSNTLVPGYETALLGIELNGGTLELVDNNSNVFGPLVFDDATVSYNRGYDNNWAMMIFSGKVTFKGTQPYVFNPAGANANLASGRNEEIEIEAFDITASSAVNVSTGALRVTEGVLRIDGSWSAVNSSVTAESGGYLGGTGAVAHAVFDGGGFECAAGQAGLMSANTVVIGETGIIHILNPLGLPADEIDVPFMSAASFEGSINLADWSVEVEGVASSLHLKVREKNGTLVAGWAPLGSVIMLQ
jgi:autotransporter-associated beta strand protein